MEIRQEPLSVDYRGSINRDAGLYVAGYIYYLFFFQTQLRLDILKAFDSTTYLTQDFTYRLFDSRQIAAYIVIVTGAGLLPRFVNFFGGHHPM